MKDLIDEKLCTGEAYKEMWQSTSFPFCWGCGDFGVSAPSWWNAPWLCERAHIVNKPRKKDRRAVILLCSFCHKQSHGEKFNPGFSLPRLSLENMLWLKERFDPLFYDREFLQKSSVRLIPEPEAISDSRMECLVKRAGEHANPTKQLVEMEIVRLLG